MTPPSVKAQNCDLLLWKEGAQVCVSAVSSKGLLRVKKPYALRMDLLKFITELPKDLAVGMLLPDGSVGRITPDAPLH